MLSTRYNKPTVTENQPEITRADTVPRSVPRTDTFPRTVPAFGLDVVDDDCRDVLQFMSALKNPRTQKANKRDIKRFHHYIINEKNDTREIHTIPATELNKLLVCFPLI